jgi:hypothetical protein
MRPDVRIGSGPSQSVFKPRRPSVRQHGFTLSPLVATRASWPDGRRERRDARHHLRPKGPGMTASEGSS